jgi:hypothetical protein
VIENIVNALEEIWDAIVQLPGEIIDYFDGLFDSLESHLNPSD